MKKLKFAWLAMGMIGLVLGSTALVNNMIRPAHPPPLPGTGLVLGKLDIDRSYNLGYDVGDLYLGRLIQANQPNAAPAVSFTFGVDPQTTVHDPDGTFVFTNILPGTYALVIWTPGISFVIEEPEGGFKKIVVEPDKTTDLGTIVVQ